MRSCRPKNSAQVRQWSSSACVTSDRVTRHSHVGHADWVCSALVGYKSTPYESCIIANLRSEHDVIRHQQGVVSVHPRDHSVADDSSAVRIVALHIYTTSNNVHTSRQVGFAVYRTQFMYTSVFCCLAMKYFSLAVSCHVAPHLPFRSYHAHCLTPPRL